MAPVGSKEIIYDSGKQTLSSNSKLTLLIFASGSAKLANAALLLDDGSGTTTFLDNIYSRFKFMNGGADLGTADVLIDGLLTLAAIPYGSLSGYDTVKSGARNVQIQASSSPGSYLYSQTQSLSAAYDYSLVAYSVTGTGSLSLFALQDNNLPVSGKAKLRFVNASSDSTAYDAYVNYTKLLTGIVPASGSKYQELDSGTSFVLSFNTSGTGAQAVTLAGQELDAAHVYTAYVYGRNGQAAAALVKDN